MTRSLPETHREDKNRENDWIIPLFCGLDGHSSLLQGVLRSGFSLVDAEKVRRLGHHHLARLFSDSGWRVWITADQKGYGEAKQMLGLGVTVLLRSSEVISQV